MMAAVGSQDDPGGGGKPPNIQMDTMDQTPGIQNTHVQNENTSSVGKVVSSQSPVKQTILYKSGMRCDTYKLIVQLKPNSSPTLNDGNKRPYRYIRSLMLSKLIAEITNNSKDILEVRRLNRSKFLIVCATSKCANLLVESEKMKEQFMAFIPANYVSRTAIVRDVDIEITEQEIRDNIDTGDFKITYMQRLNRKTYVDGQVSYVPSSTMKLVFEGQDMPSFIYLWYCKLPCEPFVQNPIQCFSCYRFGHTTKFCRNSKLCNKCYHEEEEEHECNLVEVKCLNCGGRHNSNSKSCPEYKRQHNIKMLMSTRSLCFPEANALVPKENDTYSVQTKNSFAVLETLGNQDSSNTGNYNLDFPGLKCNQPTNNRNISRYVPPPLSIARPTKRKPENNFNREKLLNQNKKNRNMFESMTQLTKPETYYKGNEIASMMYKGCEENKREKANDENKKSLNLKHPDIEFSGKASHATSSSKKFNFSYEDSSMITDESQVNLNNKNFISHVSMDYQQPGSPHLGS